MLKIFGLGHHTEDKPVANHVIEEMETETSLVVHSPSPPASSNIRKSVSRWSAKPLRLVYCDERGKFRMDPEAVAALQLVKGPVGAVSVCGRARQGKSFILNQVCFTELSQF